MGNDGGSIPGRKDLVKSKKRRIRTETEELVKRSKSKYCSLSKEPLKKPIVGDKLGQLYNKCFLIQCLLEKKIPLEFNHLTSLKVVKDLNIEINNKGNVTCPISCIEFSGINKFYFVWNCGCVMSGKAINEIGIKNKCVVCGKEYLSENGLISLNMTNEEKRQILKQIKAQNIQRKRNSVLSQGLLNKKRERDRILKDN